MSIYQKQSIQIDHQKQQLSQHNQSNKRDNQSSSTSQISSDHNLSDNENNNKKQQQLLQKQKEQKQKQQKEQQQQLQKEQDRQQKEQERQEQLKKQELHKQLQELSMENRNKKDQAKQIKLQEQSATAQQETYPKKLSDIMSQIDMSQLTKNQSNTIETKAPDEHFRQKSEVKSDYSHTQSSVSEHSDQSDDEEDKKPNVQTTTICTSQESDKISKQKLKKSAEEDIIVDQSLREQPDRKPKQQLNQAQKSIQSKYIKLEKVKMKFYNNDGTKIDRRKKEYRQQNLIEMKKQNHSIKEQKKKDSNLSSQKSSNRSSKNNEKISDQSKQIKKSVPAPQNHLQKPLHAQQLNNGRSACSVPPVIQKMSNLKQKALEFATTSSLKVQDVPIQTKEQCQHDKNSNNKPLGPREKQAMQKSLNIMQNRITQSTVAVQLNQDQNKNPGPQETKQQITQSNGQIKEDLRKKLQNIQEKGLNYMKECFKGFKKNINDCLNELYYQTKENYQNDFEEICKLTVDQDISENDNSNDQNDERNQIQAVSNLRQSEKDQQIQEDVQMEEVKADVQVKSKRTSKVNNDQNEKLNQEKSDNSTLEKSQDSDTIIMNGKKYEIPKSAVVQPDDKSDDSDDESKKDNSSDGKSSGSSSSDSESESDNDDTYQKNLALKNKLGQSKQGKLQQQTTPANVDSDQLFTPKKRGRPRKLDGQGSPISQLVKKQKLDDGEKKIIRRPRKPKQTQANEPFGDLMKDGTKSQIVSKSKYCVSALNSQDQPKRRGRPHKIQPSTPQMNNSLNNNGQPTHKYSENINQLRKKSSQNSMTSQDIELMLSREVNDKENKASMGLFDVKKVMKQETDKCQPNQGVEMRNETKEDKDIGNHSQQYSNYSSSGQSD
eukprot:403343095